MCPPIFRLYDGHSLDRRLNLVDARKWRMGEGEMTIAVPVGLESKSHLGRCVFVVDPISSWSFLLRSSVIGGRYCSTPFQPAPPAPSVRVPAEVLSQGFAPPAITTVSIRAASAFVPAATASSPSWRLLWMLRRGGHSAPTPGGSHRTGAGLKCTRL